MSSAKRVKGKDRRPRGRHVVIVGAGAAGLAAGMVLREKGIPFSILEATGRVGGRIWTRHPPSLSVPVELGAEFTHGEAEEVMALADERGLTAIDIAGRRWRTLGGELRLLDDFWERLDRVMRRLREDRDPDRTFAEALARNRSLDPVDRALALQFVQGFHAAHPEIISERALADGGSPRGEVRERRMGRLLNGYGAVIGELARDIGDRIRLRSVVRRVAWREGAATVFLGDNTPALAARAVIITVPLGVLAASPDEKGAIAFDPPLSSKEKAIGRMAMGNVMRIALQFDEPFWTTKRFASRVGDERLDTLTFLHGHADAEFPIWWTTYPVRSPLLVGWCGGPKSLELTGRSRADLQSAAIRSLADGLSVSARTLENRLVASYTHDWIADPFVRGAYSYARVGGDDAPKQLARPVEGTLFFAGEATDPEGRNGTVHGAIGTGYRAAEEVIGALR